MVGQALEEVAVEQERYQEVEVDLLLWGCLEVGLGLEGVAKIQMLLCFEVAGLEFLGLEPHLDHPPFLYLH